MSGKNEHTTGLGHADRDEIVKAARRRARAADSRRRALAGDRAAVATDGPLALQPEVLPAEPVAPAGPPRTEPAPPRRKRARRPDTVAPPAPVTTPRTPFVVGLIGLVAAGIVGLLLLNSAIAEDAFALHGLREQQSALDAREQRLTDELAELSSPGNLAAAAKRLGLVPAEEVTYIRLPDGRELTMPAPGAR